jgi:uncharacterized protein (TIGR02453 family)
MSTADDPARFTGFSHEAFTFYRALESDNTKAHWTTHKATYDEAVKAPLLALTAELTDEFGPFRLFRPHRDVRFSKDKSPYKTHQGAVTEGEGGESYYVQVSGTGMFVATGHYRLERDQLERLRTAIDDDIAGDELVDIVDSLRSRYEIGGRALTTAPRGWPKDHARIELLRHKALTAAVQVGEPKWVTTRRAVSRVAELWRGAASMNDWLARHVGPTEQAPPEDV